MGIEIPFSKADMQKEKEILERVRTPGKSEADEHEKERGLKKIAFHNWSVDSPLSSTKHRYS